MANDRKKYDSTLFLDRKQAAELLGVQVDTVTKLVKDGKIIAFRTSPRGKFHIPITELNKLRTGTDGATAEELAAQLKAMEEGKKANQ